MIEIVIIFYEKPFDVSGSGWRVAAKLPGRQRTQPDADSCAARKIHEGAY